MKKRILVIIAIISLLNVANAQWSLQTLTYYSTFYSVYFTDVNTGYIAGESGFITKTTDGGSTWTTLSTGTTNDLNSITFTNSTTAYACGGNGTIIKTTNSGTSWTTLNTGVTDFLCCVRFINANSRICGWW